MAILKRKVYFKFLFVSGAIFIIYGFARQKAVLNSRYDAPPQKEESGIHESHVITNYPLMTAKPWNESQTDSNRSILPAGKATSKRRQRMSSNRRRKRVEKANGNRRRFNVEKPTSFQRLWTDVASTSTKRRRFNVWKSISFPCFICDVVSMFKSRWKCKWSTLE